MRIIIIAICAFLISFNLVSCRSDTVKSAVKISKTVKTVKSLKNLDKLKKLSKSTASLVENNKTVSWTAKNNLKLVHHKNKNVSDVIGQGDEVLGTISEVGSKKVITTYSLTSKKVVNPLLDKRALPNAIYKVENQVYKTDHLGRTVNASIDIIPKSVVNRYTISNRYEQLKSLNKGGMKGVHHGGHLIGHSLGGNSGSINIVPQTSKLNMGAYSSIESFVTKNKLNIKNYNVKVFYKGNSQVPDRFLQSFEFYGDEKLLRQVKIKHKNLNFLSKKDDAGKNHNRVVVLHSNIINNK